MNNWQDIQTLFHLAQELPATERSSFVMHQLEFEQEVRDEVLRLLSAEEKTTQRIGSVRQEISSLLEDANLPQIAGYDIIEPVASGGMGSVYKARDKKLSRDVAIKLLHPHRSQQEKSKQRFTREARATAKIRHENICPVYEIGETASGALYIASAFCEGESLAVKIRSSAMNLQQILSIIKQLSSALTAAHEQNVVHRDLKPENIIVDKDNRLQLVDFGIARIRDDHQSTTGEIMGTLSYMSPEQFRGEAIDPATDIWAFGILLYELLEGVTPYQDKTAPEIVYSMLHEPIRFSQEDDGALAGLYALVRSCLQLDKNLRPKNAENLSTVIAIAAQEISTSNYLDRKPDHQLRQGASEPGTSISLSTERRIIVLSLILQTDELPSIDWGVLQTCVRRYRGSLEPRSTNNNRNSVIVSAWFGYPLADELAIKNSILCGLEWQRELTSQSINFRMIAGYEKIIEDSNTTLNQDTLPPATELAREQLLEQIDQPGFWLMNKLAQVVEQGFASFSQTTTVMHNGFESSCHLVQGDLISQNFVSQWQLSPFIGRQSQLDLMVEGWQQTLEGDQQSILISGEAGIGKSRLIHEFSNIVNQQDSVQILALDCSPYEQASTYYPILNYLRQGPLAEISELSNEEGRSRIRKFLKENIDTREFDQLLLGKLLGLQLSEQALSSLPTGDLLNREYQSLLLRILSSRLQHQARLIIFEDMHWADSGTDAIVEQLLRQSSDQSLMVVLSCRPEYSPAWLPQLLTSNLLLSKLRQSQCESMLRDLLKAEIGDQKNARFDQNYISGLSERTGGNPLFIEELAKNIGRESKRDTGGTMAIPETLQDTLVARLERLGVAQDMAQVAAVIGRDFAIDLLRHCTDLPGREFEQQLNTLIQAGIVQPLEGERQGKYRFKHALIRDAAYQMLLPKSRRQLHQHIANTIENHFDTVVINQPELLAQHCEVARDWVAAVDYWQKAAQRNLQLSAISECLQQSRHGIELTKHIDNQVSSKPLLLALYMTLGPALMARFGYADDQVNEAYLKAHELSGDLDNPDVVMPILFGLWTYHCVRAQHRKAFDISENMVSISDQNPDADQRCEAFMLRGINAYYRGEFENARDYFKESASNYNPDQAQHHILLYGQDPGVVVQNYQAWTELVLGNTELASQYCEQAIETARQLNHPFTLVYALSFGTWTQLNLGQLEAAQKLVGESIEICQAQEISVFLGLSLALQSLVYFTQQEAQKGFDTMQKASEIYLATGAKLFLPSFQAAQAEVEITAGNIDEAEQLLNQAIAMIDISEENWCRAPILGLLAVVCQAKADTPQAGNYLQQCKQVIEEQNAQGLAAMLKQKGLPI